MDAAPAVFARSIAAAARSLGRSQGVAETLQTIVEVLADSVPGFDQVGITTVDKAGRTTTRAHIGALVHQLDDIQYCIGEGPGVDTLRGDEIVVAPRNARSSAKPSSRARCWVRPSASSCSATA